MDLAKKTRHLGGLSAIRSYFLLVSFSFLALPSRSSVHSAMYTGPGIILSSIYTSVRFVSCDDTGRKEKMERVHRTAFSVGERDDRLRKRFSSASFYFIGCNLPYYILSALVYLASMNVCR